MFTGVDFKTAIDLWEKGREVIVIDRSSQNTSGGYDNFPFEELFRGVELLADVPAVESPVFAEAVADMVQGPREEETVPPPLKGPEVEDTLPAAETKKETAVRLAGQGKTTSQIAKETGIPYSTVYNWLHPEKCKPKKKPAETIPEDYINPDAKPGWNADRKKCKTCRYRQGQWDVKQGRGSCDYLEITGHSRGCAPGDCDRYVKGPRMDSKKR